MGKLSKFEDIISPDNKTIKFKKKKKSKDRKAIFDRDVTESKNILCIGDDHKPFHHRDYLDFVCKVRDKYSCEIFVHMGDDVDNHAISYHESDPDGFSAGREYELALKEMKRWYKEFDHMLTCVGNHSKLHKRRAMSIGLPQVFLKSYQELWEAPKSWVWDDEFEINDVLFFHGYGSGKYPHVVRANNHRQSCVMGHHHSTGGVEYLVSRKDRIFGMCVGCGVDRKSYAMSYGKDFDRKPVLGCGVITDGGKQAIFVPMDL